MIASKNDRPKAEATVVTYLRLPVSLRNEVDKAIADAGTTLNAFAKRAFREYLDG